MACWFQMGKIQMTDSILLSSCREAYLVSLALWILNESSYIIEFTYYQDTSYPYH